MTKCFRGISAALVIGLCTVANVSGKNLSVTLLPNKTFTINNDGQIATLSQGATFQCDTLNMTYNNEGLTVSGNSNSNSSNSDVILNIIAPSCKVNFKNEVILERLNLNCWQFYQSQYLRVNRFDITSHKSEICGLFDASKQGCQYNPSEYKKETPYNEQDQISKGVIIRGNGRFLTDILNANNAPIYHLGKELNVDTLNHNGEEKTLWIDGDNVSIRTDNGTENIFVKEEKNLTDKSFLNGKTCYSQLSKTPRDIAEILYCNLPRKTVEGKISQLSQRQENWIHIEFYKKNLLSYALEKGYWEAAKKLIGSNYNSKIKELLVRIAFASIKKDNVNVIKWLIENNYIDANQESPDSDYHLLFCAITEKKEEIVDLLLSLGANPNQMDAGMTMLTEAILYGTMNIVKKLIQSGANVNLKDRSLWTPLDTAIYQALYSTQQNPEKFNDITEYLLFQKADYSSGYNKFESIFTEKSNNEYMANLWSAFKQDDLAEALRIAKKYQRNEMIKWISNQRTMNESAMKVFLEESVRNGNLDEFEKLLAEAKKYYLATWENRWKNDLLFIAIPNKHSEIVDLLIKEGANVNARINVSTPLHQAVISRDAGMVQKLVNAGAKADVKDNQGRTPAQYATDMNRQDIIDILNKASK